MKTLEITHKKKNIEMTKRDITQTYEVDPRLAEGLKYPLQFFSLVFMEN